MILNQGALRLTVLVGAVLAIFIAGSQANQNSQMVLIDRFYIDQAEVTIGQFSRYIEATGTVTRAERTGGGLVYGAGWEQKSGWTWRTPFGRPAHKDEPAVHITFDEAQNYCRWTGKRLPTEAEWIKAAYTEYRPAPPKEYVYGRTYPYPTGDQPTGANCLNDCGSPPALDYSAVLDRGRGPAKARTTKPGVNGLFDMGANVWEWVDISAADMKGTRGGSWWYGAAQMRADYSAQKPREMSVVYIGFRCVKDY